MYEIMCKGDVNLSNIRSHCILKVKRISTENNLRLTSWSKEKNLRFRSFCDVLHSPVTITLTPNNNNETE